MFSATSKKKTQRQKTQHKNDLQVKKRSPVFFLKKRLSSISRTFRPKTVKANPFSGGSIPVLGAKVKQGKSEVRLFSKLLEPMTISFERY